MLRFTIRDLLWLTVVVGMWMAWLMDRRQLQYERGKLRDALVRTEAEVNTWKIHFSAVYSIYKKTHPHEESESLDELQRQAQSRFEVRP